MKRSLQEIVELVVFALIALLIGTGVLWLLGLVFGLVGTVLGWLAALLWGLLSFLLPVALLAAVVVFVVRWAQGRPLPGSAAAPSAHTRGTAPHVVTVTVPAAGPAAEAAIDRAGMATATDEGMPPAPAGTPPVVDGSHPVDPQEPAAPVDDPRREG